MQENVQQQGILDTSVDEEHWISFRVTKEELKTTPTRKSTIIQAYRLPQALNEDQIRDLVLEVTFTMKVLSNSILRTKSPVHGSVYSGLVDSRFVEDVPKPKVVIGAVIGYPKCGKSTFLRNVLTFVRETPSEQRNLEKLYDGDDEGELWADIETPFIKKVKTYTLNIFAINSDLLLLQTSVNNYSFHGKIIDITFLDTRGYYFDPEYPVDQVTLEKFIQGAAECSQLSKAECKLNADANNAPTHVVLAICARDLYT